MKKYLISLISVLLLAGCNNNQPNPNNSTKDVVQKKGNIQIRQSEQIILDMTEINDFKKAESYYNNKKYSKAIKLYKSSAKNKSTDSVKAQIILGDIYSKGTGVDKNSTEALKWYLLADKSKDNILLKYKIANTYDSLASGIFWNKLNKQPDPFKEIDTFELSKNDKEQEANFYKKARQYLEVPLQNNMPEAQALMARYYIYGVGVKEDIKKGISLYEKAANKNHEASQARLGNLYYDGDKVEKNIDKAIYWLEKAASNGNMNTQFKLGYMYAGSKDNKIKDLKKSIYWYEYACNQKSTAACNNLGHAYQYALGVEKDIDKATSYYEKSANNGGDYGQMNMGYAYLNGNGKTKNYTEAFYWFKKSADQQNKWSQNEVGILLVKGYGTNKDYKLASEYFIKASDQNITESKAYLSIMYKHGFGVKKDIKKSDSYKYAALHVTNTSSREDYSMAKLLWNEYVLLNIVKEEEN